MVTEEQSIWILSTFAQSLAALIGLVFIGLVRYVDNWKNLLRPYFESIPTPPQAITVATSVRTELKKVLLVLPIGVIIITLNTIAISFSSNPYITLPVIGVSSCYTIFLSYKLHQFILNSFPDPLSPQAKLEL